MGSCSCVARIAGIIVSYAGGQVGPRSRRRRERAEGLCAVIHALGSAALRAQLLKNGIEASMLCYAASCAALFPRRPLQLRMRGGGAACGRTASGRAGACGRACAMETERQSRGLVGRGRYLLMVAVVWALRVDMTGVPLSLVDAAGAGAPLAEAGAPLGHALDDVSGASAA